MNKANSSTLGELAAEETKEDSTTSLTPGK
jgi:hypothetical protein